MKKTILFILTLMMSVVGFSQTDTSKSYQLKEVIISVRSDDKTPVTQKTIKKEEIGRNYFGQDMTFILNSTPAMTAYSDNGLYNSYTYFRLRGVDQTRINMTLNGIPLNEPEDQGVYFSNYPDFGSNLNSAQIQRGVGISSYGSSSFVGSINFEGPNLLDTNYTSLETGLGSYNSYRTSVGYNSGLQKNGFAIYGRYSMIGSDGYKYNVFNRSRTFFTSAGYYGKKDVIKLTAFSGLSKNGMGYLATNIDDINIDPRTNYLTKDEQDNFEQDFTSLQWVRTLNNKSYINTSIFYNHLDGNYDIYFNPDMANFRLVSNFYGITTNYSYTSNRFKFNFGGYVSRYDRSHMMSYRPSVTSYFYTNKGLKNEISSFVKAHYNLSKNIVIFGDIQYRNVTFNYVPDKINTSNIDGLAWNFINPKGGVKYSQNNNLSYYASIGQTHREPTRNDLFNGYDDISPLNGNTYVGLGVDTIDIRNIKPESVIDYELGFDYCYKNFSTHLNGYYMDFKNEIAAIGRLSYIGLPLRKNVASSYRTGVEFDMTWKPIKGLVISQNINYCYAKIKEYTTDYDSLTYKNVTPLLTPNLISNTSISYTHNFLSIGVNGRYVSKSFLDNTQNNSFVTPEYFILGGNIGVNVKNISVKILVNNITNQKYYNSGYVGYGSNGPTSAYFVSAPRNYYVTMSYKF